MTINTNYNYSSGGYYQMNSQQQAVTSGGASSAQSAALKAAAAEAGFSSAYLLDLSGDAAAYLSGLTSGGAETDNFTLTSAQKDTLVAILKKYAGEPQTQETFNAIQDALKQAGLDPDRMAAKDQANSFNPTTVLIDILSGTSDKEEITNPEDLAAKQDTQKSNYIDQLITLWKSFADVGDREEAVSVS